MEHEKMSGCLMPAFSERFWIYSLSLSSVTVSSKLPTYSTAFLPVGFFLVTRDQRLSSSSSASGCTCSVGAMVSPVSFCSAVDSCGRAVVCERSEWVLAFVALGRLAWDACGGTLRCGGTLLAVGPDGVVSSDDGLLPVKWIGLLLVVYLYLLVNFFSSIHTRWVRLYARAVPLLWAGWGFCGGWRKGWQGRDPSWKVGRCASELCREVRYFFH